jgi:hypothetical protein
MPKGLVADPRARYLPKRFARAAQLLCDPLPVVFLPMKVNVAVGRHQRTRILWKSGRWC